MEGSRREAMHLAGAALVGATCATAAAAEPPAASGGSGPAVVLAGNTADPAKEQKGFTVKTEGDNDTRYRVTFDKPLPRTPVVVASLGAGVAWKTVTMRVTEVTKEGFTVSICEPVREKGVPGVFSFIVVLV